MISFFEKFADKIASPNTQFFGVWIILFLVIVKTGNALLKFGDGWLMKILAWIVTFFITGILSYFIIREAHKPRKEIK